ncbi:ABC transporter ATP-binding protein [Trueperella bialowiezensis]|uniref:Arginine transport ATP-binding protein ArtM n=1 Tax=Trueperella bialowiezensis TaxID=312285 RepID=A0A3S4VA72_9ACTO|nr:ABC transporter ATP-binding protein [Trueperella bialowiezensis]VEI13001.1 Arginine transport ATP-binding protein ArtM [Trueperella bialowiezensis]
MITVENLTKDYGKTRAVDNLSFSLRPGAVTGFLGPNGSGKSTTMRCIVGLDRPTSGRVLIRGVEYGKLRSPLTMVGALLDGKAFHPGRTARQHLQIVAATHGFPKGRVDEVIAMTGLASVAKKKIGGFSLGMGQRLGIATALLGDPQVLIFDEPVNGLDPDGVRWVRHMMRELAREGRTVLVSSHLMSEMSQTADDLIIIGRGRFIDAGPITRFTESDRGVRVRVQGPDMAALHAALTEANWQVTNLPASNSFPTGAFEVPGAQREQIGNLLYTKGLEVHELTEIHSSLEDVFMELTSGAVEFNAGGPAQFGPHNGPTNFGPHN